MSAIFKCHYRVIGVDGVEMETTRPIAPDAFREDMGEFFDHYGRSTETVSAGHVRSELRGSPKFPLLAGPMYDGEVDGVPRLRYETWAAYDRYSA